MTELEEARSKINEIDTKMAELFEERMNLVVQVANYKKKNGMQVFDSSREKQVIERCVQYIKNIDLQPYYVSFIQDLMDISKKYQHKLLEGAKIAYSGIEGAFANIAAKKIFPDGVLISYSDFESAYESVENGECDVAVLPIENSYAGEVGQVNDLMFTGKLYVNGIYGLPVTQNLLAVKGANLSDIKTVISEAVTNAIVHAYPDGNGTVTITARILNGDTLEFVIRDKGLGIPNIDQAMEPMFTTGGEERSGMGFTIMQSFTDRMSVVSKPGKGTKVTLLKRIIRIPNRAK